MKVTLDYFPGPDPDSVTYKDVEEITTIEEFGFIRLVLHRSVINGGPSGYSTPLYLIKGIHIEQENLKEYERRCKPDGTIETDQDTL